MKQIFKIFLGAFVVLFFGFASVPSFANAQTEEEITAKIKEIEAQIASLKSQLLILNSQLSDIQSAQNAQSAQSAQDVQDTENTQNAQSDSSWCYDFKNYISSYSMGEDVRALQTVLQKESLYDGPISGYYGSGSDTYRAVVNFQKKHRVYPVTGGVYSLTLMRLNALYGCNKTIAVTSPNNGETFTAGQTLSIKWTANDSFLLSDRLKILVFDYTNPANTKIVGTLDGICGIYYSACQWSIPARQPAGTKYKISIEVYRKNSLTEVGFSDGYFSIEAAAAPSATVTSPNGGEIWRVGEAHDITWTSTGFSRDALAAIRLYRIANGYFVNNGTVIVTSNAPNTGSYTWTVPNNINAGDFKVRIVLSGAVGGSAASQLDWSDNVFSITSATSPSASAIISDDQLASISDALAKIAQEIRNLLGQ